MAKIEELVRQISDGRLRDEITTEIKELKKHKRFGLVFEEHLPEMLRLPKAKIRLGNLVAHRDAPGSEVWRVIGINGKKAKCRQPVTPGKYDQEIIKEFPLEELVLVVSFGEPIYPILTPIDRLQRGGPDKPWHVLINADNYHALQLLLYSYERKVDLIYIDPPYNTGARDWKYNNDYVDRTDAWRHSKWLSMMKKRLTLAKRLLKVDGILVITIDDNEVHHLLTLTEELFREYEPFIVTIEHNKRGRRGKNFGKSNEFALFFVPGNRDLISEDFSSGALGGEMRNLRRTGSGSRRHERPRKFFPIWVNEKTLEVVRAGEPIAKIAPWKIEKEGDLITVWPIDKEGVEKNWHYAMPRTRAAIAEGKLEARRKDYGIQVYYRLRAKESKKYKTVWSDPSLDASTHGTELLTEILGRANAFEYPKSVYATYKCLEAATRFKPKAIIVDFFAGSGTTLHATALLNEEIRGERQCILVTNNEVSEHVADNLQQSGLFPGDPGYERNGISENVAWPRCKYATQGCRDDRSELTGEYLTGREMKEGFDENIEYFRLDFVDPADVERGDAFEGIFPILWLMAGAIGERESRRGTTAWYIAKHSPFAVLIQETKFREFQNEVRERKDVTTIFLVTDSDDNFASMRRELGRRYHCVQLYKSYLENFRINTVERLVAGHDEESE